MGNIVETIKARQDAQEMLNKTTSMIANHERALKAEAKDKSHPDTWYKAQIEELEAQKAALEKYLADKSDLD